MTGTQDPDTHLRDINITQNDSELKHFRKIVNAFRFYKIHSFNRAFDAENSYHALPDRHKKLIPHYQDKIDDIKLCMNQNYEIIKLILSYTSDMFENSESADDMDESCTPASAFDMDKVKSTLKQFVRDWSSDGQAERDTCYLPVIEQIKSLFPSDEGSKSNTNVRVLVPGAGLGRLAWEIAKLGYTCQGNEVSLFMLFASNFVLNKCDEPHMLRLHPWVHQFSNLRDDADQTRAISFPDVNPGDISMLLQENSEVPQFSMSAGDFLEVYTEPNSWDCVSTVFFIDTASNVMSYIEKIWNILKPGGYWINLGPLLYHFADMPLEQSIELSYEDLKSVIKQMNFKIIKEEKTMQTTYTQNVRSMLKYQYDCVFFVAQKPHDNVQEAVGYHVVS